MKSDIRARMHELGIEGEEADETIEVFMADFRDSCEALRELRETCEEMPLREVTHKMIGYASISSAMDLHEMAVELNQAAKAHDNEAIVLWIDRILELLEMYEAE